MPGPGHRIYATHTVRVSKTIEAPLSYVYGWCTDYRTDDWKVSRPGTHPRFRVIRPSARRVIRLRFTPGRSNDPLIAVDLIRLEPPDRWHTDQIDEEDRESVDYQLTALGPERSRLDLLVTERWIVPKHLSRVELRQRVSASWDRYVGLMEVRYRRGLPAKG